MGKDKVLPEKAIGVGDEIIGGAGDDGPPAAPGDVGETDVVAEAEAAEEEGDPERRRLRQVGGRVGAELHQVGRIEAEGQGLLLQDKKIGFQGIADEGETAAKDGPPQFVQVAVAGVILLHLPAGFGQDRFIR